MPASHANLDFFRRVHASFSAGDMETLQEYFADDVVWHTPGNHPGAGTYTGKAATFESFAHEFERSAGTYTVEIREALANDELIVASLHAKAQRQGRVLDQNYAIVFHVGDGKIVEAWEVWSDQAAVDSFWG